jgi:Porin subfamily
VADWTVHPLPRRRCLNAATIFFATTAATMATMAVVKAQTLTNPSPKTHARAALPQQDKQHIKPCPAFGAGFMQVPGSDLCIKIGGYVQYEAIGR